MEIGIFSSFSDTAAEGGSISFSERKSPIRLQPAMADWIFWISMPMLSSGEKTFPT